VGLLQGMIESAGIATVGISQLEEVTRTVAPSRALFVDTPLGHPLGVAGDRSVQRSILEQALALFERVPGEPLLVTARLPEGVGVAR